MNEPLFHWHLWGASLVVTPWKLVGYLGVLMFAGRWFVQLFASHHAGQPYFPRLFWYMSLLGSLLLLSYFVLSDKRDSVGVMSNLFPFGIALYNLYLEQRYRRRVHADPGVAPTRPPRRDGQEAPLGR